MGSGQLKGVGEVIDFNELSILVGKIDPALTAATQKLALLDKAIEDYEPPFKLTKNERLDFENWLGELLHQVSEIKSDVDDADTAQQKAASEVGDIWNMEGTPLSEYTAGYCHALRGEPVGGVLDPVEAIGYDYTRGYENGVVARSVMS